MIFELPSLPYAYNALEPYISEKTLKLHHDVLQRRYVQRLNRLAVGPWAHLPLEDIVTRAPEGDLLDNAAQVFNHTFLWYSMTRQGGGEPSRKTGFGQAMNVWGNRFRQAFLTEALKVFGSGYVWLVADERGDVLLSHAQQAGNPMRYGYAPLLNLDVWEHAYLLDYGADRKKYVTDFLNHLVNWRFAEANYARAFGA